MKNYQIDTTMKYASDDGARVSGGSSPRHIADGIHYCEESNRFLDHEGNERALGLGDYRSIFPERNDCHE